MSFLLIVSTPEHFIKAYDLEAALIQDNKDPLEFRAFDRQWGHSDNIIRALELGSTCEFLEKTSS